MSDYDCREGAATRVSNNYACFMFSTCLLNPQMLNRHRHCQRRRTHLGFPMMAPDSLCQPAVADADVEAVADTKQVRVSVDCTEFLLLPCRRGLTGEVVPYLSGFRSEPAGPGFLVHPSRRGLTGEVALYLAHPDADDDAESKPT